MRRRWKLLLGAPIAGLLALALFIGAFEVVCGGDGTASAAAPYEAIHGAPGETRPEAQSWLTYPEWHIVYSAEAFAATLDASRPSAFAYARDVRGFWSSYCTVNRATAGMPDRGTYKTTVYTIGVSFTAEMAIKAAYEWTVGRFFEWTFGAASGPDRYSAEVQAEYAAFLHETPWYEYPFGRALSDLWRVGNDGHFVRAWERRLTLTIEYGSKAVYSRVIAAAVGATGRDERTMRLVAAGSSEAVAAVDPRLVVVGTPRAGLASVDAPRYEQFTELTRALARSEVGLVEIAGNDDIFITALVPVGSREFGPDSRRLFTLGTDGHPGFERAGIAVKVRALLPLIRQLEAAGGRLEHVYDY